MHRWRLSIYSFLILALLPIRLHGQLQVTASTDATALAQELVGPGVVVSNAVLNCGSNASGFFQSINTPLGIDSGIFLGSGTIFGAVGPNNSAGYSTQTGSPGDPDLDALITPYKTFDACILEFDVQPFGDTLKFDYVFGSEEYDEYVCSQFNDVFAFFISGSNPNGGNYVKKNVALIPNSSLAVTINSVNNGTPGSNGTPGGCTSLAYSKYYQSNAGSSTLQYDGQTVVLGALLPVIPCNTYHLALKVADAQDRLYDSGVFLRSGSLTSNSTEVDVASNTSAYPDLVEGCLPGYMTLTRSSTTGVQMVRLSYGGSAIRGTDYSNLPDSVFFQNGFNTLTFPITPYLDTLPEYVEDLIIYIINPCNGQALDSATIMIYDSIQIESKPDTTVCMGDTISLWAKDALNYYWSSDPDIISVHFDSVTVVPSRTHTFRVESTIGVCSDFDDITVTVVPYPWVDAGPDIDICMGTVLQLPLSDSILQNPSYKWAPDSALAQTILRNPYSVPLRDTRFYVTVTNEGICSTQDSLDVKVHPLPTVYAGQDVRTCMGDSVYLEAVANRNGVFHWSPATGLSDTNGAGIWASPSTTTQYTVTFTDSFACSSNDRVIVQVDPLPNVQISASQTQNICLEDTLFLQGSGALSYHWEPAEIMSNPDSFRTVAVPLTDLTIVLTGTDHNGCEARDSMPIQVFPIPDPKILTTKDSICEGDSLVLKAEGNGLYTWQSSTGQSFQNADSLIITPASNVVYTLSVENSYGCIKKYVKEISVFPRPMVTAGPDTTICQSSFADLKAGGGIAYEWRPSAGLTCSDCANPRWMGDTTTVFTVLAYNEYGCFASDELRVEVIPLPNLSVSPLTSELCAGESITLSASGGIAYRWEPDSLLSNPLGAQTMATPLQSTVFTVYIEDAQGCQALKTIPITVHPLPQLDAGPDDSLCLGSSIQLNVSGASQISWSPPIGLSNPNIPNPVANPTQSVTYTITGTDQNACSNAVVKHIEVLPLPHADAGPSATICQNEVLQLSASGGIQYTWSPSLGLSCTSCKNPQLKAVRTTQYSVLVEDQYGCRAMDSITINVLPAPKVDAGSDHFICYYDSAQLQATGGENYFWFPPEGLSDTRIPNPVAKPPESRMYYVRSVDTNGCEGIDSVRVIYFPVQNVLARGDTTICRQSAAILKAQGVQNYRWEPAEMVYNPNDPVTQAYPDSTTIFTVTGVDNNGCFSLDSVRIAVNPLPDLSLPFADTTICKNTYIEISPGTADRYIWKPGAVEEDPQTHQFRISPEDSTIYTVIAISAEACIDSQSFQINIYPPSDPMAQPPTAQLCPGDSIWLSASNGVDYYWEIPPSSFFEGNDSLLIRPDVSMEVTVSIRDQYGCFFSDSIRIQLYDKAMADAGDDQRLFFGESLVLNGYGNGSPLWTPVRWLSNPNLFNPEVKPDSSIYYILTITTPDGCRASDTVFIEVYYETLLFMPNAFTPNGDGKNDFIGPVWQHEFQLENFSVYNRWGQLLFRSSDPNARWDGQWNGVPQPAGTYVYIVEGYGNRGEHFFKQGNFILIR